MYSLRLVMFCQSPLLSLSISHTAGTDETSILRNATLHLTGGRGCLKVLPLKSQNLRVKLADIVF